MRIISPVVRDLPVSDLERAVRFYRDVLSFEVSQSASGTEAILGPARLHLGSDRPPGSATVFFQTTDVAAFRQGIAERGGAPGPIHDVNWIKMRSFHLSDPDGNTLWFGQSYHEDADTPSRRPGQPSGLRQALPELPCDDVAAAVKHYCDVLGFRINYQQDDLGVVYRDAITVLLIARTERHKGIGSFEVYVDDADALYEELTRMGATVDGPPVSYPWGLRTFRVFDCVGNRITFAQTFE